MGRMKALIMEYVERVHPNDYDKQDELFNKIVSGEAHVTMDDMLRALGKRN